MGFRLALLGVSVVAMVVVGGCSWGGSSDAGNAPEKHLIDEVAGTYNGAGLGDNANTVTAALGGHARTAGSSLPGDPPDDRVHDSYPKTIPYVRRKGKTPRPPDAAYFAYPAASFYLVEGIEATEPRVIYVLVIKDGAATNRGVAIGDSLQDAEEAYPEVGCDTFNVEGIPPFPFCAGELRPGRNIWFGGDPIDTIELNKFPFPNGPN